MHSPLINYNAGMLGLCCSLTHRHKQASILLTVALLTAARRARALMGGFLLRPHRQFRRLGGRFCSLCGARGCSVIVLFLLLSPFFLLFFLLGPRPQCLTLTSDLDQLTSGGVVPELPTSRELAHATVLGRTQINSLAFDTGVFRSATLSV